MKRSLIAVCTIIFLLFCQNTNAQDKTKDKEDKSKMKDKSMDMKVKSKDDKTKMKSDDAAQSTATMSTSGLPYTANYSSNFTIGNPDHSKMILDLWKDWDDNAFNRHDYMADTLVMILPDGKVIKGKAANLEAATKYRGGLKSSKSTLDVWIPLKSMDRNEDWVALWGQAEDVQADGKTEKRELQEVWRINKDGKVDFMKQYAAATPQAQ